jgi:hypothetical protein
MQKQLCSKCKSDIDSSRVIGFNTGWCLHCRDAVQLSVFETQGWILGVLVVLTTLVHFD